MTTHGHTIPGRASIRPREGGEPGAMPGHFEADEAAVMPVIDVMAFGPDDLAEARIESVSEISNYVHRWPVTWVNVEGLGDADVIQEIGALFGLHPLALEDVVHVHQRAKVEDYGNHEFIVARMATFAPHLDIEQVSIFLGEDYVLTFQERPGDCLDPLRDRIRRSRGRVRGASADYLAYAVLDGVVDNFFPVLEQYSDRLEVLEDEVLVRPSRKMLAELRDIRHDLLALRRAVMPLREALSLLHRDERGLFRAETLPYLRDCYDHSLQILDSLEAYRQISASLMDTYLSSASNRMNEAMHLLTVVGTIFLPLTFITGLYGMNFDPTVSPWNMPELGWAYGYPAALTLMMMVAVGQLIYFRKKRWLRRNRAGKEE